MLLLDHVEVDSVAANTGNTPRMTIDSYGNLHTVYRDVTNNALRYGRKADFKPWSTDFGINNDTLNLVNGDVVEWWAYVRDHIGLDSYMFRTNDTGVWVNQSWSGIPGTGAIFSNNITFNYTITADPGDYICGQFYFNDTSNLWNQTPNYAIDDFADVCFEVAGGGGGAYYNFTSPINGSTLTHTIGINFEISDDLSTYTNCNYTLTWKGDNTSNSDWEYPSYSYGLVTDSCSNLESFDLNVDFDGEYDLDFCGTNAASEVICSTNRFYVDRSELTDSKIIGSIIFSFIILGSLLLITIVAFKMPDLLPNNMFLVIPTLFSLLLVISAPIIISNSVSILQEFFKNPTVVSSGYVLITILVWVATYLTLILLIIKIIYSFVQYIKKTRFRGRKIL